jgi:signal transduction histidine kinase
MGKYESEKQVIDIANIAQQAIASFKERYPDRIINADCKDSVFIQGEPLLIHLLLNNLLDNAHKYSNASQPISLRVYSNVQSHILEVADQGEGIPESEREKVFEKFYRMGEESTRTSKGTGLGLFLCKKIADFHDANIKISNHIPSGSVFTITFPIR